MDNLSLFSSLGVALAAGLIIGFERERSATGRGSGSFLGGVRTHPLLALLGAISMLLARQLGVTIVLFSFVIVAAFLLVAYFEDVRKGGDRGLTSEVAFLLSFGLGALAMADGVLPELAQRTSVVASVAVVTTLLLSIKPKLHAFVQRVSSDDLFATLKFLVIAIVVLPLLPDRELGPLEALNPRSMGLMVVLISGISFVGYLATRLLGTQRGLGLSGLVGGLASSTAVTLSFSGRAKAQPQIANACALAIVLASSIMFGRILLEVWVVNRSLVGLVAIPMVSMLVAGLFVSLWFYRRSRTVKATADIELKNPFELSSAIKFALIYGLVLLVSKAATTWFGSGVTYLTGILAGATDVDAITLSMARLARDGVAPKVAVTTILLGAASNTIVKAVMTIVVGGWAFGRHVALALAVILAAGGIGLAAMWIGQGS